MKVILIILAHLISAQDVGDHDQFFKSEIKAYSKRHASQLTSILFNIYAQSDDLTSGDTKENFHDYNKLTHLESDNTMSRQCLQDIKLAFKGLTGGLRTVSQRSNWAKQMWDSYGTLQSGIIHGNIHWQGDFWECISLDIWRNETNIATTNPDFMGKYCLVSVTAFGLPPKFSFKVGMCFPSTCNEQEIQTIIRQFVPVPLFAILHQGHCQTKQYSAETWDLTSTQIKLVLQFLIAFIMCATVYEYFLMAVKKNTSFKPTWGQLFLAFSAHNNAKSILDVQATKGTFGAIHGMRVLSMAWVVLGHVCLALRQEFPMKNPLWIMRVAIKNPLLQFVINAEFSVDTFLCISGFLIAYITLSEMRKRNGYLPVWAFYLHRIWRLVPAYLLVLGYMSAIYPHAGNGPIWPATNTDMKVCRSTWWRNILFISTYFEYHKTCLPQLWYLCVDTAFYVISPILFVSIFKFPRIGKSIFIILFIASFLIPAYIIYYKNIVSYPTTNNDVSQRQDFIGSIYVKPWCRMSAFLIGMIYGYIVYLKGTSMNISRSTVTIGWIVTSCIILYLTFGTISLNGFQSKSTANSMFIYYGTLTRPAWALAIGWIILACCTDNGGYINDILSFRGFIPFSKLSYTAFLVHFTIIAEYFASRPDTLYVDVYTVLYYVMFILAKTMVMALIVTLLAEAPIIALEKLILKYVLTRMDMITDQTNKSKKLKDKQS